MSPCLRTSVILLAAAGAFGMATPSLAADQPPTMAVTAVRVEGNTLLPEATLGELTAGVAGGQRSMAELNAVAARIQRAYRDAGYGGVLAYVPPQESTQGTVVVRVVEGKLAAVRIKGNAHYDLANVRAGLPNLREGATPRVTAIDRDIQLTNDSPAKQVKVTLTAGARPGEIDADIGVSDSNPVQFLAGYNNTGTRSTGRHRVSVGVQHANLFNRDHVGTLQYQTSPEDPGRVRIYSAGYRIPLYSHAASIDAFFARSSVSIGTTATVAGLLNFTGRGSVAGLRANRHLDRRGEYDHHVTLGIDRRDYDDECSVSGLGAAGCGSAAVDLTTAPLSIAYVGQRQGSALGYGISALLSVNAGGSARQAFQAARLGAQRHYAIARFSGYVDKALAHGVAVNARLEMQYTPHRLIAAERYGIGGAASVRGYLDREFSGDLGYLARVEASMAVPELAEGMRLRPYLFLDHGRVRNHGGTPCRDVSTGSCSLSGVGFGGRLGLRKNASASLDVGRALERGFATSSGDVRGHVAINLLF
jgi:hemolysin activation/secretion protein